MVILTFKNRAFHGHKGNTSIVINLPDPKDRVETCLQEYIIKSIVGFGVIRLIPFVFENKSMMETAKHYLFHMTASPGTFSCFSFIISKFCLFIGKSPDQLVADCTQEGDLKTRAIEEVRQKIDEYIFYLKERKLSSITIYGYTNYVNSFFRINEINLDLNFRLRKKKSYSVRSFTLEELQQILKITDLRETAIAAILATSGLRTGTLVKLRYRHVKRDLEKGFFPIHIYIEAAITKGKYHSYSTFINQEAAEFLKKYLDARRKGSAMVPPEIIHDESPLIRIWYHKGRIDPMSARTLGTMLRKLFFESGIISKHPAGDVNRYELDPNSFRKFFRSQMSVLGVQPHFIEYMMGHKNDHYYDIKMAGVEYLRRVYRLSGISLNPPKEYDKLVLLKQAIERLDLKPQDILKPDVLKKMKPYL